MYLKDKLMQRTSLLAPFIFAVFSSSPSLAAMSEIELLHSYIGSWKGKGTIIWNNEESEVVVCRLKITKAKEKKVNYNGRCAFAGGNFSISGTMAYIDEKKRFEAVMSSSTSFAGVAIGERKDDNLEFQLKNRNAETGDSLQIDSEIKLNNGELFIRFTAQNITTGRIVKAQVPFFRQ